MNRDDVLAAIRTTVQHDLDGVEAMAQLASDEATSSESKSEGKYDTRATEASYLARGQADRVVALRRLQTWVTALVYDSNGRVRLGSLVQIRENDVSQWVFVLPEGGGLAVSVDDTPIRTLTPDSPVGAALMGAEVDDEVEVQNSERLIEIVDLDPSPDPAQAA